MGTNDSSNPAQCPLELVEILKRLGAHRRELHAQVFGKPLWTCEQSEATVRQLDLLRSDDKPQWTREQSDAFFYHPLVRACEWLETRVQISRYELEHAAFRLTTSHGLKSMDPFPSPDGGDFLTAIEENAKRELCELYDLMAADKTPPELKGQGKPVQLTEKQQAALAGLSPNCFQVISEEQAEALAQLPGTAVQRRRPSEGDPGMPDWLWMTGKFRELDRDGTANRDSTTTRLWRQLSEEYPTILAEAGIPVASQAPAVEPLDAGGGGEHPPPIPKQHLTSWREILVALGKTNNDEDKQKVDRLNKSYNGPIVKSGQGTQPFVEKRKLLEWWNGLEKMVQDQADRSRDAKETVKETYAYGRDGEVVPEISGQEKKRRKDRKP